MFSKMDEESSNHILHRRCMNMLQCVNPIHPIYHDGIVDYYEYCRVAPLAPVVQFLTQHPHLFLENVDFQHALLGTMFPIFGHSTAYNALIMVKEIVLNIKRLELFLLGLGVAFDRDIRGKIWLRSQVFCRDWNLKEKEKLIAWPDGLGDFLERQFKYALNWHYGVMKHWDHEVSPTSNTSELLRTVHLSCELNTVCDGLTVDDPRIPSWLERQRAQMVYTSAIGSKPPNVMYNVDKDWVAFKTSYSNDPWILEATRKMLHYGTLACPANIMKHPMQLNLYNAVGNYLSVLSVPIIVQSLHDQYDERDEGAAYDRVLNRTQEMMYYAGLVGSGMSRQMMVMTRRWYLKECLGLVKVNYEMDYLFPPWAIGGCIGYEGYEAGRSMYTYLGDYAQTHMGDFLMRATYTAVQSKPLYGLDAIPNTRHNGGRAWVFTSRQVHGKYDLISEPNKVILMHDVQIVRRDLEVRNIYHGFMDNFGIASALWTTPSLCTFYSQNFLMTVDTLGIQRTHERWYHDFIWQNTPPYDFTWAPWLLIWLNAYYSGGFQNRSSKVSGLLNRRYEQLVGGAPSSFFEFMNVTTREGWGAYMLFFSTLVEVGCRSINSLCYEYKATYDILDSEFLDMMHSVKTEYVLNFIPQCIVNTWFALLDKVFAGRINVDEAVRFFWKDLVVSTFRDHATPEVLLDSRDVNWLLTPTPRMSLTGRHRGMYRRI